MYKGQSAEVVFVNGLGFADIVAEGRQITVRHQEEVIWQGDSPSPLYELRAASNQHGDWAVVGRTAEEGQPKLAVLWDGRWTVEHPCIGYCGAYVAWSGQEFVAFSMVDSQHYIRIPLGQNDFHTRIQAPIDTENGWLDIKARPELFGAEDTMEWNDVIASQRYEPAGMPFTLPMTRWMYTVGRTLPDQVALWDRTRLHRPLYTLLTGPIILPPRLAEDDYGCYRVAVTGRDGRCFFLGKDDEIAYEKAGHRYRDAVWNGPWGTFDKARPPRGNCFGVVTHTARVKKPMLVKWDCVSVKAPRMLGLWTSPKDLEQARPIAEEKGELLYIKTDDPSALPPLLDNEGILFEAGLRDGEGPFDALTRINRTVASVELHPLRKGLVRDFTLPDGDSSLRNLLYMQPGLTDLVNRHGMAFDFWPHDFPAELDVVIEQLGNEPEFLGPELVPAFV